MIFVTYWYVMFATLAVVVFWTLRWPRARLGFLALACLVFQAHFAGPAGMLPIIVLAIITYLVGLSRRGWACVAGIALCVAALCFYKYSVFLLSELITPFSRSLAEKLLAGVKAIMPGAPPLGISFFAFEFVHYLFEVRRGGEPIRNPLKFLLFALFFPSLVAGPIKRYTQYLPSLEAGAQRLRWENIAWGLWRVGQGFFKKLLIADNLTFLIDHYQPQFASLSLAARWGVFAAIAFRILMDFSGYSDIAIGCAQLFGVRLPENFNWPYVAHSLQDFWQRWHISLSSWFRDYVFLPLEVATRGNPNPTFRASGNVLLTMLLCGLWHGPAWNFVVWGLYHGAGLVTCATYRRVPVLGPAIQKVFAKEPLSAWLLTQAYAWFGWLVFFYPIPEALRMAGLLFGL
jgi:alginate O-acetyltransferase complex protein AlgI